MLTVRPKSPQTLGERIQYYRTSQGLTQPALARQAGITAPFLSLVETGNKHPSIETLMALAKILGVTSAHILGEVELLAPFVRRIEKDIRHDA